LFEFTAFLIDLPFTNFLSIYVLAFVPELAILVVTLPRANLHATIKGASLQRLSILAPPLPVSIQFAICVLANCLQPSALVVERPLPMPLAVLETSFARKSAVREELLVRPI
jgi:hypothetical protein